MLGVPDKNNIIFSCFKMGRRVASLIFIAQAYFSIQKFYRENMFYLALLPPLLPKDMNAVMQNFGDGLDKRILQNIFQIGTSQRHTPLVIDVKARIDRRFRKGLDGSIIPVPPPIVVSPSPMYPICSNTGRNTTGHTVVSNDYTTPKHTFDHDDYMTPKSAWEAIAHLIPKDKVIWEAFYCDGCSGEYLRQLGFDVIHKPVNFFESNYGDIIVTNPPFSKSKEIMKRLKELDKPFIVIMPSSKINTSYFRDAFMDSGLQIIIPTKRIQLKKLVNGKEIDNYKSDCPFNCFYYCFKMNLEKDIMWLRGKSDSVEEEEHNDGEEFNDTEEQLDDLEDLEEDNTNYILLDNGEPLFVEYIGTKVYDFYTREYIANIDRETDEITFLKEN
jgi:hypothetical protein